MEELLLILLEPCDEVALENLRELVMAIGELIIALWNDGLGLWDDGPSCFLKLLSKD